MMKKINIVKFIKFMVLALGIAYIYYTIDKAGGPLKIFNEFKELGYSFFLLFIPYIFVILFDAIGWHFVIAAKEKSYSFFQLLRVKLAGDCINVITPAGSMAGDPAKAYILKRYNVSLIEGMASVYILRLLFAKSQILYVFLGFILASIFFYDQYRLLIIVGLIILGVLASFFLFIYYLGLKKGITNVILTLLKKLRLNFAFIEKQQEKLKLFDEKISHFYKNHKVGFFKALFSLFVAWIIGSVELYLFLYLKDIPIDFHETVIIESIISVVKALTFFSPGNLGFQDYTFQGLIPQFIQNHETVKVIDSEAIATAFNVFRRTREGLWVILGMIFLSKYKLDIPGFKKEK